MLAFQIGEKKKMCRKSEQHIHKRIFNETSKWSHLDCEYKKLNGTT